MHATRVLHGAVNLCKGWSELGNLPREHLARKDRLVHIGSTGRPANLSQEKLHIADQTGKA